MLLFFVLLASVALIAVALFLKSKSPSDRARPKRKFQAIPDNYETYEDLQQGLRDAGLESCNLIIAIDYTKSNEYSGRKTWSMHKSMHEIERGMLNPYQQVITVVGRSLAAFDEDQKIPVFGFGDSVTKGDSVFSLSSTPCNGVADVLNAYAQVTPTLQLSGPTNFGPAIREAINIVKNSNKFHMLVIIADGQVIREQDTIDAIVQASKYPLSIIMVGVGDGPWVKMKEFDDKLPARSFDNFQFVNFHEVMGRYVDPHKQEIAFAVDALMELPDQYLMLRQMNKI